MNEKAAGIIGVLLVFALVGISSIGTTLELSKPQITDAYVDPVKVRPGDTMLVTAEIEDDYGISSVTADMGGIETIELELVNGSIYKGVWQGEWQVHDTVVKNYTTTITATNGQGLSAIVEVEWSDPINYIVNGDFESGSEPDADNWSEVSYVDIKTEWDSTSGNPSGNMYMYGGRGNSGEGDSIQEFNYTGSTPPTSANLSFDWYRSEGRASSSLYVELMKPGEGAYNTVLWSVADGNEGIWTSVSDLNITGDFTATGTYRIRLRAVIAVSWSGGGPKYADIRWDNVVVNISDTTPPVMTIESPTNSTYGVNNTDYNVTSDEALNWAFVSINGGPNMTMGSDTLYHYFNLSSQHVNLSDGSHNATFYAQDLYGNNASKTVYFSIDTTAPEINIESPQNATYPDGNIHFNISVTNVNMTNGWVNITGESTNYTLVNDSLSHWYNVTVPTLSEGYYTATFYGNRSGNMNSKNVNFTMDNSTPYRIDLNYPFNNLNLSSPNIYFNWTSYDNVSTSLTSNLTIDGVVNVSNIPAVNATPEVQTVSGLSDGPHNWNVTTWDPAGNSNTSVTYYFIVDTTPPTVVPVLPVSGDNVSGNISINASVNDTSGVDKQLWSWENGTDAGPLKDLNGTLNTTTLQDGDYNITYWANDTLGNSNGTKYVVITVDNTPPAVVPTLPTPGIVSGTIKVNASVSDTSGVDVPQWRWVNGSGTGQWNSLNGTLDTTTLQDGDYNVSYWANDTQGNINGTEYIAVTMDNTPPTVTLNVPANNTNTNNTSVTFNFTAADNLDTYMNYTLYLDGIANTTGWLTNATANTTSISGLSQGPHTWSVNATDNAGNTGSSEVRYFTVDTTVPAVTITSPPNTTITDTTPDLNFTIDETTGTIYNWDDEGNVSGCIDCMFFNTTYGEASGSDGNISLLAHLNEGSGTTANDGSTYDNNGTITGATWVTGKFGNALDFSGTDEVDFGDPVDGSLDFNLTDSFTIVAWIKIPSGQISANAYHVIDKGGAWTNPGYHVTVCGTANYCDNTTSPGSVWAMVHPDGGNVSARLNIKSTTLVNDSQWHHIAFVRDTLADEGYLYIDGVLEANETDPSDNTSYTSDPFIVGNRSTPTQTFATGFTGSVDGVVVIRRALGSSEIQGYYDKTLSDGQHNVTVYTTDRAGNMNSTTRYFTVDTIPPTTSDDAPSSWQTTPFTVTLTCLDATSGCASTAYRVDGGTWNAGTSVSITTDGNHTIAYNSTDNAGNVETTKVAYAALDQTPPATSDDAPLGWQGSPFTVNLICQDNSSGCAANTYRVDGGAWTAGTSVGIAADGNHTIAYNSTDNAGNVEATRIAYAALDAGIPSVQNPTATPSLVRVNDTVNITANVTDAVGIDTVLANITNGTWSKSYPMINTGNNLWSYEFNETNSTGTYTATIIANDSGGNVNDSESVTFNVSLPDLTLNSSDITFSNPNPTAGDTITITADVHNVGPIDTNSGQILLMIDNTTMKNDTLFISGGGTENITYDWITTAGLHTIAVVLDVNNTTPELNETNNDASRNITVTSPPPPPPGGGGNTPTTTTTTTTTPTTTVPTTTIPPQTPQPDSGSNYRHRRDRTIILPLELGLPLRIIKSAFEPVKEIIYILNIPEILEESWNPAPWYYEDEFVLSVVALFVLLIGLYRRR